jgi:hypothetical protein
MLTVVLYFLLDQNYEMASFLNTMSTFFVTGQYLSLKKQLERLKICFAKSPDSMSSTYFGSSPAADATRVNATWQMLDMGKLDIS